MNGNVSGNKKNPWHRIIQNLIDFIIKLSEKKRDINDIILSQDIPESLKEFTICLWLNLIQMTAQTKYFSYATSNSSDNTLAIGECLINS